MPPPPSSSTAISHAYTALLSTFHERTSLLSAPGGTIPPSLNRALKRQIGSFGKALDAARAQGSLNMQDARVKWERIVETLEKDEEGRKVLVAARDSHPLLMKLTEEEEEDAPAATTAPRSQDQPYRDSPSRSASPEPQDHAQLMQDQKRVFEQQDSQLDTLSLSIGRQRDLSLRMNEELELQSELLDGLDDDVERTGLRLGRASGQLDRVRRKVKDHGSLCALFGLIVLLVTLIILFK
ncbi:unnamed protein product [Parajaminaea phylloscopi]